MKNWDLKFFKADGRRAREATGEAEWTEAAILLRQQTAQYTKKRRNIPSC
jgi:hypothetical protein